MSASHVGKLLQFLYRDGPSSFALDIEIDGSCLMFFCRAGNIAGRTNGIYRTGVNERVIAASHINNQIE